jgi:hypothetical protein
VVVVVLAPSSLVTATRKGTCACQLWGLSPRGVASSGSYVHPLDHSGKNRQCFIWRQVPRKSPAEGARKSKPGKRRRKIQEKLPWIVPLLLLCL